MKNLFIGLCLSLFVSVANAGECSVFDNMSRKQIDMLNISHSYGVEHDLGMTLAAIAWRESQAGRYPLNVNDPSMAVGLHHVLVKSAIKRSPYPDTHFGRNQLASDLMNPLINAEYAMMELLFWQERHDGNWRKMVGSYNAGYQTTPAKKKAAASYAAVIASNLDRLTNCTTAWQIDMEQNGGDFFAMQSVMYSH